MKKTISPKRPTAARKIVTTFFWTSQAIVTLCLLRELALGNWKEVGLSLLAMFSFCLPYIVEHLFHVRIPEGLLITIFIFIFAAEVLGEINNFYRRVPIWDTILHTVCGFLAAGIGFALINTLCKKPDYLPLSLILVMSFAFSMMVGSIWEIFEYSLDIILLSDTQKDTILTDVRTVTLDPEQNNNVVTIESIKQTVLFDDENHEIARIDGYLDIGLHDTMKDLIVNLIGAIVFGVTLYLYDSDPKKYPLAGKFKLENNT